MRRSKQLMTGVAMSLAVASGAWAGSSEGLSKNYPSTASGPPEKVVYDEASAMEWFRQASGSWVVKGEITGQLVEQAKKDPNYSYEDPKAKEHKHGAGMDLGNSSFQTIGAGSTVMETYLPGSPYQMTVMFHMDGPNRLQLDHYCAARNVPELKFVKTNKPGEIKFVFDGGTNLNPAVDGHLHDITYQVIDKDTYKITAVGYQNGKPMASELTKVREAEAATARTE